MSLLLLSSSFDNYIYPSLESWLSAVPNWLKLQPNPDQLLGLTSRACFLGHNRPRQLSVIARQPAIPLAMIVSFRLGFLLMNLLRTALKFARLILTVSISCRKREVSKLGLLNRLSLEKACARSRAFRRDSEMPFTICQKRNNDLREAVVRIFIFLFLSTFFNQVLKLILILPRLLVK